MSDTLDPSPTINHLHEWLGAWEARIPRLPPRVGLAWRRDGLVTIYNRLEQLKLYDEQLSGLLAEAQLKLANARAWGSLSRQQIDEIIGPGIESATTRMAGRGMASEERWLAHRTKAAVPWSQARALERIEGLLEGAVDGLRTLVFAERDERNDLRAQLRAINVGIEIGEL